MGPGCVLMHAANQLIGPNMPLGGLLGGKSTSVWTVDLQMSCMYIHRCIPQTRPVSICKSYSPILSICPLLSLFVQIHLPDFPSTFLNHPFLPL